MSKIETIKNLGPKMAIHFQNAGITSAEEIYELGLEKAFLALIQSGVKPHFMIFVALAAGLQDLHWSKYYSTEKDDLRARYDLLLTTNNVVPSENAHKHSDENIFDELGLRAV